MFVAIIFALIIVASIIFHFWSPWWWTPVASNWGNIDDTIILTFWVTGAVFVAVCLFMSYCVWAYRYRPERKAEYKPEDKKLEFRLTWLTTLGVVALLAPGLIVWNKYISVPENAFKIEVVAYQWGWNYRLPGDDGILGKTSVGLINDDNPYGLDLSDPNSKDDILVNYFNHIGNVVIESGQDYFTNELLSEYLFDYLENNIFLLFGKNLVQLKKIEKNKIFLNYIINSNEPFSGSVYVNKNPKIFN